MLNNVIFKDLLFAPKSAGEIFFVRRNHHKFKHSLPTLMCLEEIMGMIILSWYGRKQALSGQAPCLSYQTGARLLLFCSVFSDKTLLVFLTSLGDGLL
ncbi:hypothetical protein AT727_03715 [Desulfitobacterium hafniense]|uniref:Uncharacterized protein n=1 Tax=Desulfitobacterium hafniense TaxID=49338 RepID=A0A0W1JKI0_DESHA|nr:hypothetical protein AT727_03715 [Desulfitobacterium hafniense]